MVGIHGEIMENERENLHQLPGARDEVFALAMVDRRLMGVDIYLTS